MALIIIKKPIKINHHQGKTYLLHEDRRYSCFMSRPLTQRTYPTLHYTTTHEYLEEYTQAVLHDCDVASDTRPTASSDRQDIKKTNSTDVNSREIYTHTHQKKYTIHVSDIRYMRVTCEPVEKGCRTAGSTLTTLNSKWWRVRKGIIIIPII